MAIFAFFVFLGSDFPLVGKIVVVGSGVASIIGAFIVAWRLDVKEHRRKMEAFRCPRCFEYNAITWTLNKWSYTPEDVHCRYCGYRPQLSGSNYY
jgi:hypothetical protein